MDNQFRDLDDISKELRRKSQERRSGHRRNSAMHRQKSLREVLGEHAVMLVLPAIILLLMIVIKVLEPAFGVKDTNAVETQTTVSVQETVEANAENDEEEAVPETTQDPSIVASAQDEELLAFFKKYFDARLASDIDTIYQMTGTENQSKEQTQALKAQLKTQAGYIERYQDLSIYQANGIEDNEKIVFLTYNVKFRRVETLAPGIMYCYLRHMDDGWQIIEKTSPEQVKFINNYLTNHNEVTELINSSNSQLLQALTSDGRLAIYYDALQTGRIYNEDQSSIDSEVSLVGESTTNAESASSSEGETTTADET